tara:strand:+ start:5334 stop:7145 length:1812 start_codon:yes stop_codon:yes gene_type:complete
MSGAGELELGRLAAGGEERNLAELSVPLLRDAEGAAVDQLGRAAEENFADIPVEDGDSKMPEANEPMEPRRDLPAIPESRPVVTRSGFGTAERLKAATQGMNQEMFTAAEKQKFFDWLKKPGNFARQADTLRNAGLTEDAEKVWRYFREQHPELAIGSKAGLNRIDFAPGSELANAWLRACYEWGEFESQYELRTAESSLYRYQRSLQGTIVPEYPYITDIDSRGVRYEVTQPLNLEPIRVELGSPKKIPEPDELPDPARRQLESLGRKYSRNAEARAAVRGDPDMTAMLDQVESLREEARLSGSPGRAIEPQDAPASPNYRSDSSGDASGGSTDSSGRPEGQPRPYSVRSPSEAAGEGLDDPLLSSDERRLADPEGGTEGDREVERETGKKILQGATAGLGAAATIGALVATARAIDGDDDEPPVGPHDPPHGHDDPNKKRKKWEQEYCTYWALLAAGYYMTTDDTIGTAAIAGFYAISAEDSGSGAAVPSDDVPKPQHLYANPVIGVDAATISNIYPSKTEKAYAAATKVISDAIAYADAETANYLAVGQEYLDKAKKAKKALITIERELNYLLPETYNSKVIETGYRAIAALEKYWPGVN